MYHDENHDSGLSLISYPFLANVRDTVVYTLLPTTSLAAIGICNVCPGYTENTTSLLLLLLHFSISLEHMQRLLDNVERFNGLCSEDVKFKIVS